MFVTEMSLLLLNPFMFSIVCVLIVVGMFMGAGSWHNLYSELQLYNFVHAVPFGTKSYHSV